MQSMSSAVTNHRTGPPPISPSKRKHSGDQPDEDIDCDNEHVAKMSRLFAAQLELAKMQRPPAFLWEDAGLSSCDLAMIKVSGKPANGDYRKDPRDRSRSPIERAAAPAIGIHGNHLYTHVPSLAMDQPLALTKNSMDAARTASISPALGPMERQQNRPSVITCASANNRNCNLSHCPVSHNGCTSSLPANYRRPSNTNTACDPVIEEHFRRSLGKNYKEPEPVTNSVSITGSVDDHFAKALGETWLQPDLTKLFSESGTPTGEKYGGCVGTNGACLPPGEAHLLLQFAHQLRTGGPFKLLYPATSPGLTALQHHLSQRFRTAGNSGTGVLLAGLLSWVLNQTGMGDPEGPRGGTSAEGSPNSLLEKYYSQRSDCGHDRCSDPHLRQVYTDPPLALSPPFSPGVREYQAEVPFDTVTVRIRAEPVDCSCQVHLDERRGPRMANYPVGLGSSRISILVTDESEAEPVIMTIYTLSIYRQTRPSLPMFSEHVTCGFQQDCGLLVQPDRPCGLEPLSGTPSPGEPQVYDRACSSGDAPGRWVVPCLSCSDNRTCDWREVSWQPYGCRHPVLTRPQLQSCLMDRKVLFIGDSTNRGMMYYLMERVNATLQDWDKAHDTIVYHNVNQGHTLISYSYYPQFWLEKARRPTFKRALELLIERSRPLEDSAQTVLVAGGVQWLNTNHLTILHQVLKRENLLNILVVVKSLGMGFHLPVDGIRSLSLRGVQDLYSVNENILTAAKHYGYEVIDTFRITMGRYKEFLQGKCACHFHEVGRPASSPAPLHRQMKLFGQGEEGGTGPSTAGPQQDQRPGPGPGPGSPYHVHGPVNQVYSEILLSRLCASPRNSTLRPH